WPMNSSSRCGRSDSSTALSSLRTSGVVISERMRYPAKRSGLVGVPASYPGLPCGLRRGRTRRPVGAGRRGISDLPPRHPTTLARPAAARREPRPCRPCRTADHDRGGDMDHGSITRATRRPATGLVVLGLSVITLAACGGKQVTRIDPGTVTDLSGRWNDTDSRLVANALIEQSLTAPWARQYADAHGGEPPAVIVGEFRNRTLEHIAVGTFVRDLERAFVNSGAVRVVASADERAEVRAERQD